MAKDSVCDGRMIKVLRIVYGDISQGELAKSIHCSRTSLSLWESGQQQPSRKNLQNIANYFDLPVGLFVKGGLELESLRRIFVKRLAEKFLQEMLSKT